MTNEVDQLAAWAAEYGAADEPLPDPLGHRATRCILDTVGVTIAGSLEPTSRVASAALAPMAPASAAAPVHSGRVWGAERAAMLNGISAHVLDFDDWAHDGGHLSAVITPVVLAVAQQHELSGSRALRAYVAGTEIMSAVGHLLGPRHSESGWHVTSTAGVFGAAAAAGALLGLGAVPMRHALAIAGSGASGTVASFGTMTKSLHAGRSAALGVQAAMLAAAGFTGGDDILTGKGGILSLLAAEHVSADGVADRLGQPFQLLDPGVNQKLYPCCGLIHAPLDLAAQLRRELLQTRGAVFASAIETIEVNVPFALTPLTTSMPRTPLERKFSMAYCVSRMILDGVVGLPAFERCDDPAAVEQLFARVRTVRTSAPDVEVAITLTDGARLAATAAGAHGQYASPLSDDELAAKFRDTAGTCLAAEELAALEQLLWDLAALDVIPELAPAPSA